MRLLELGDRADVPGAELVGVAGILALGHEQLTNPLLRAGSLVDRVRVVLEHPLVDTEQVDTAGVGIGERLEDERHQLTILDRGQLDTTSGRRPSVGRGGQILDDRIEQPVHREVLGSNATGDGEDQAGGHSGLECGDDLVVGDLLALEVALHQLVGDLGDLIHQLLAVLGRDVSQLGGNLDLGAVLTARALVLVGLHVDQVDHAADLVLGSDRNLGGDDVGPEGLLERIESTKEVGPLAVEHVHEDQAREAQLLGALPESSRSDLDAEDGVDHEDRPFGDAQRGEGVGDEAGLTGSVDQVDLAALPAERGEARRDRHAARLLVRRRVRDRRAVCDRPKPADRTGLEEQGLVD